MELDQSRCHNGLDERLRQRSPPGLFQHQRQVDLVPAAPTEPIRHDHAEQPDLRQRAPQLRVTLTLPPLTDQRGRRLLREQVARNVAQRALLVGKVEVDHRGSPKMRSATMLFWISLVPA